MSEIDVQQTQSGKPPSTNPGMNRFLWQQLPYVVALVLAIAGVATPVWAQTFRVGRLLCVSEPRVGLVLGSAQALHCTFYAQRPPRQYVYEGRIRRVGLDFGVTSAGTLSWVVLAKNARMRPGTLQGSYVGASANIAVGPSLGANVLIGGSRRSVMLQPLSVERAIGLNLAAGVTNLTLGPRSR